MLTTLTRLFLLAFTLAFTSSLTHADPIVITSGSLSVNGLNGIPSYSFSGPNFSVTAVGHDFGNTGPASCFPCVSGQVISTNSIFGGSTLGSGTVMLNGITFNNVFLFGLITFTGPSIIIPETGLTNLTLTAPFTLSGPFGGCFGSQLTCETIVFSTQLSGTGIASIRFEGFVDSQNRLLYDFRNVTYTFTDATVPEPTSILLLTGGVAALVAGKRKLRASRRRLNSRP